jgi:hypothetical protein
MLELSSHQAFQLCHRGARPEVLVLPENPYMLPRDAFDNHVEKVRRKWGSRCLPGSACPFLKNPDIAACDAQGTISGKKWKKSGANGDLHVSLEVLVLSENPDIAALHIRKPQVEKARRKMGIEVFAWKCSSFLKNPDIAA